MNRRLSITIAKDGIKLKNTVLVCFVSAIILTFFAIYNIAESTIYIAVALVLLIGCIVLFDAQTSFLLAIAFLPNISMMKFLGAPYALFGYFMLLVEVKYLLLHRRFNLPISAILFSCSIVITSAIYADSSLLLSLVRFVFFVLFVATFSKECISTKYIRSIIVAFSFGYIFSVVAGIIYANRSSIDIFSGLFAGIRADRNYFSALTATAIAILFVHLLKCKTALTIKVFLSSLIAMFCFVGLLSGSRTFVLSLIWCVIAACYSLAKRKNIGFLFAGLVLLAFIYYVFEGAFAPLIERMVERFSQEDVTGGNGRLEAWEFFLRELCSSPRNFLFGNGNASSYVALGLTSHVEHNTIVQALSTVGVVGFACWATCLRWIYKNVLHSKPKLSQWVSFVPLLVYWTCYMAINGFLADELMIMTFAMMLIARWLNEQDALPYRAKG